MKIKKVLVLAVLLTAVPRMLFAAPDTEAAKSLTPPSAKKTAAAPAASAPQNYQFSRPAVSGNGEAKAAPIPGKESSASGTRTELSPDYKILIGDRLDIKIYPEDQYIKGGPMQVSSEGGITLPLVGKFKIADKTIAEAERELVKIIDADYLVNPEVVIQVAESILKSEEKKRKAIALGQVRKPGTYEFPPEKEKISLLELISLAGGFTEVANIKKIKIIRKHEGKKDVQSVNGEAIISGDSPDVELNDGDVINVAESVF